MTEKEKELLRQFFIARKAWRRHIKAVLQTAAEIESTAATLFPPRQRADLGRDFLVGSPCFMGTAQRRKYRRMLKYQSRMAQALPH